MKLVIVIVCAAVLQARAFEQNYNGRELFEQYPGEYGQKWMYFPDGNNTPQIAKLSAPHPRAYSPIDQFVTFHLYTRINQNESQILIMDNNTTKLNQSNYDSRIATKLIIHGWRSGVNSPFCQRVKDRFLNEQKCNVIIADWSPIASNFIYPIPAMETRHVGNYIAKMIAFLLTNHGNKSDGLKRMHLIGHSLGAHIAGYAGNFVAASESGKIARITGLDPALPGFEIIANNFNKLDETDAEFVDVIHTCAGVLGYYAPLGHVDFYPNGGIPSQPGCFGIPQIVEACSHGRSWQYFAASIQRNVQFLATECPSWANYVEGLCANRTTIPMGEPTPNTARGIFYLNTKHFIHEYTSSNIIL